MGDRGPDGGFRKLFAHRFDGIQSFMDGAVAVGVHVRLHAVACEAEQDGFERWRGEVDGWAAILARRPARRGWRALIGEIGFQHGAGEGGRRNHTVQEQLRVVDGDGGRRRWPGPDRI